MGDECLRGGRHRWKSTAKCAGSFGCLINRTRHAMRAAFAISSVSQCQVGSCRGSVTSTRASRVVVPVQRRRIWRRGPFEEPQVMMALSSEVEDGGPALSDRARARGAARPADAPCTRDPMWARRRGSCGCCREHGGAGPMKPPDLAYIGARPYQIRRCSSGLCSRARDEHAPWYEHDAPMRQGRSVTTRRGDVTAGGPMLLWTSRSSGATS
jgi:hypothetical protein